MQENIGTVFARLYRNEWKGHSGRGSAPAYTEAYRKLLSDYLRTHEIKSVLDVGCGDWQFSKLIDWTGIEYVGIDAVEEVIAYNNIHYAKSNIKFRHADAVKDVLPQADLIIIKDCLQHLSCKSIQAILNKMRAFKHILVSHDYAPVNGDCVDGGYRKLNLQAEPFNLNVELLYEFSSDDKKTWKVL
jgi:2-polyprenyl-3-methyl-5-hydroxy-6-metoxy-1,4-benzoquinol methylase